MIETFWKNNQTYWFDSDDKTDNYIYDNYLMYNLENETLYGKIIYYDQFSRHFSRINSKEFDESKVYEMRIIAHNYVLNNLNTIKECDEFQLVFSMMPFKHLKMYEFIFDFIHNSWLKKKKIMDFNLLNRFYNDTYKKAYTFDRIEKTIQIESINYCKESSIHSFIDYDYKKLCDYYPEKYQNSKWSETIKKETLLETFEYSSLHLDSHTKIRVISLSGGVDSMTMCVLFKALCISFVAVHIIYGNRKENEEEYKFISHFCEKLKIPLYCYRIEWLQRDTNSREFYEEMTKTIRFNVYIAVCNKIKIDTSFYPEIYLGHILDDVVENIWTNIAKYQHVDNLKKMVPKEYYKNYNFYLCRPFLNVSKKNIYEVSEEIGIPYLKNTTPIWSNRGKFRKNFHPATKEQFGNSIDKKILEFSDYVQHQSECLNKMVYQPLLDTFDKDKMTLDISTIVTVFNEKDWLILFEKICHSYLSIKMPSKKSITNFNILLKNSNCTQINMNKYLKLVIKNNIITFVI
jgi:tRNA(Ile)-lysidine synthetase-like protein